MAEQENNFPTNYPFAEFFRYFGIVLAIAVALAPMLTRYEDLLPMYAAQKEMLTFFTSLVCLLSLGVIFSIRRSISRRVFPLHTRAISSATMSKRRWFRYYTPMIMMLASIVSMVGYYYILDKSVKLAAADFSYSIKPSGKETSDSETFDQKVTLYTKLKELIKSNSAETIANNQFYLFRQYGSNDALVTISINDFFDNPAKSVETATDYIKFDSEKAYEMVLAQTPAIEIRYIPWVILSFVLIYLGASVAFAWFGLVEYLQKENELTDNDLLYNPYRVAKEHAFRIDAVDSSDTSPTPLYFKFSYDPKQSPPVILEAPSGPYIENYGERLEYFGPDKHSEFHVWAHRAMIEQGGNKKESPDFTAKLKYAPKELHELMYKAAFQELNKLTGTGTNKIN